MCRPEIIVGQELAAPALHLGARRCWIAGGSRSEPERLPRAGLAIPGEAGHETRGVGGAYTEPPDGGREMRLRAPLCSGARNGQAFGLAKHLTNPADRSGSGQESRQPSQRCEQSMNKYNETRATRLSTQQPASPDPGSQQ